MRLISLICIFFFLVPIFSVQTVSAQPDFEVGDWDIGFKDGENITKELDEDGDVSVEFWVRNDYPVAIEVSFNFDSAFSAETNEIGSTSVGAGENESFVLEFSSVDVLNFRAEKRESFSISVSIDSYGGVPSLGDEKSISDVALLRLEQLYPFPYFEVEEMLKGYSDAEEFIWAQEEPRNQGAWFSHRHRLERVLNELKIENSFKPITRPPAAAPAVGLMKLHLQQQQELVDNVLKRDMK